MFKTLEELIVVIRKRKGSSIKESYTYKLLKDKKLEQTHLHEFFYKVFRLLKF